MDTIRRKIRVGIIGLTPGRGWALGAHVPALRALGDDYEITALCTSRPESAAESARQLRIPHAFSDPQEMATHPEVDLVVVTVKVPEHDRLVRAGLTAGKHVYCEWPLALNSLDGQALAQLATARGVRHITGLQMRASPVVRRVHDLIAEGYVGTVRSSTVLATGALWGAHVDAPNAYVVDRRNGATMVTIPFGHLVDAFTHCLGPFTSLSALQETFYRQALLVETGEMLPKDAADQLAVQGRLESGAVASIHYRGGTSRGINFHWEINGTEGDLVVTSPMGQAQLSELTLCGAGGDEALRELDLPRGYVNPAIPRGYAWNVGHLYAAWAPALRDPAASAPPWAADFDVANVNHRLIERIETGGI